MKVRIRQKDPLENIYDDMLKEYYDKKTGQLKDETEFFDDLYYNITFINQIKQELGEDKFITFEKTENGKYLVCDEQYDDNMIIDNNERLVMLAANLKIILLDMCGMLDNYTITPSGKI